MAQLITLPNLPAYSVPVNIDGISLNINMVWNERVEGWYMSVYNDAHVPIEEGIRIIPRSELIVFGFSNWELNGNLYVFPTFTNVDVDNLTQTIGRNNFGGSNNFQLYYNSWEE